MRSHSKKTGKPPNARENTGKKVTFSFRLASEWFRAWREFLDQSQTKEREPKKSRITLTLNSQLVGKFTTLKPRVSRCYSIPPPPPQKKKQKTKKQKTKDKKTLILTTKYSGHSTLECFKLIRNCSTCNQLKSRITEGN